MRPIVDYTQEVRFAVVMYGGVSLAIYINGIAQELLRMVRATAAGPPDDHGVRRALIDSEHLHPSEAVYRQLGQMLAYGEDPAAGKPADWVPEEDADVPIRTRFVVDILSGTSAGGINAIYLAKALANEQDMDELKSLWITEGDIGLLVNDDESVRGVAPLPPDSPPRSLLNGRRMYKKLLDAFRGMDRRSAASQSPLIDEIDLFVTATDVQGEPVPLQLADKVVHERRYRNVFHFRYDGAAGDNDFQAANNPLLAFAARCTSAFPFAFEPVTVEQVRSVLEIFPQSGENDITEAALEKVFGGPAATYAADQQSRMGPRPYVDRVYVDGGYLDNKPFGHAVDVLAWRRAEQRPVDRKLLYIEPAPEQLERIPRSTAPPNALQNVGAALIRIPRYETIREDLQRVLSRNRLVTLGDRITRGAERDLDHYIRTTLEPMRRDKHGERHTPGFADEDLSTMIDRYGPGYSGYHRLKVHNVTDEIGHAIARAADFDTDSDLAYAVQLLVRVWRDRRYVHYRADTERRPSFNRFLLDYDLAYRIRRLRWLRAHVDRLALGGDEAQHLLTESQAWRVLGEGGSSRSPSASAIRAAAEAVRPDLNKILDELIRVSADLQMRGTANPLGEAVSETGIPAFRLRQLLEEPSERYRTAFAEVLLGLGDAPLPKGWTTAAVDRAQTGFDDIADVLAKHISQASIAAAEAMESVLDVTRDQPQAQRAVRACLGHYYRRFEIYDLIEYPTFFSTDPGERDQVDVIRVSPIDAVALYPAERHDAEGKLAGTALHNFGAFLDARWRRNDLLWGRLDGAERLAAALLPGRVFKGRRDHITRRAHIAILAEELRSADQDAVAELIAQLAAREGVELLETEVRRTLFADRHDPDAGRVLELLRALSTDDALYNYFRDAYRVDRRLDREAMARAAARAAQVVGRMLEGGAKPGDASRGKGAWIARVGQMIWGAVEVAVPRSPFGVVVRHLTAVAALFGAVLLSLGLFIGASAITGLGATTLAVVILLSSVTAVLENYLRGGRVYRALARIGIVATTGALLYFAAAGISATIQSISIAGRSLHEIVGAVAIIVLIATVLANVSALFGGVWRKAVHIAFRRRVLGWPIRSGIRLYNGLRAARRDRQLRHRSAAAAIAPEADAPEPVSVPATNTTSGS